MAVVYCGEVGRRRPFEPPVECEGHIGLSQRRACEGERGSERCSCGSEHWSFLRSIVDASLLDTRRLWNAVPANARSVGMPFRPTAANCANRTTTVQAGNRRIGCVRCRGRQSRPCVTVPREAARTGQRPWATGGTWQSARSVPKPFLQHAPDNANAAVAGMAFSCLSAFKARSRGRRTEMRQATSAPTRFPPGRLEPLQQDRSGDG